MLRENHPSRSRTLRCLDLDLLHLRYAFGSEGERDQHAAAFTVDGERAAQLVLRDDDTDGLDFSEGFQLLPREFHPLVPRTVEIEILRQNLPAQLLVPGLQKFRDLA